MSKEIIIDGVSSENGFIPNPKRGLTAEIARLKQENSLLAYNLHLKEQENEQLKEENYQLQKSCQICENFIDGIPCKPLRDMDYDLQKVINQRDKYINALEEMREYLKSVSSLAPSSTRNLKYAIEDIINEVLDEQ